MIEQVEMTPAFAPISGRTERILQASAYAAAQFLHAPSWQACIDDVLAHLSRAAGSDVAYLIKAEQAEGEAALTVRNRWQAPHLAGKLPPMADLALTELATSTFLCWNETLRSREPIYSRPEALTAAQRDFLDALHVKAPHLLPVFAGQSWWGVILLNGAPPAHDLSATEFDALRLAADSLGSAIDRQRAERKLHRRNHELHVLNSVIAAANASLEPNNVLQTTCRELVRAFQAATAGAALIDETGEALEIVAEYITPGHFSALGLKIPIKGNPSTEYVLHQCQPLVIDDVRSDPRLESIRDIMNRRGVASMMLLPLTAGDEVMGTLGLDSNELRHFGEEEVTLAMSAVSAASQALAKARLLTAEQENAARLEQIFHISSELAKARDEQTLLNALTLNAAQFAPSGICTIFLVDAASNTVVLRAQAGLSDALMGLRIPQDNPIVQIALQQQKPIIIPDIDREAPQLRRLLVREGINAFYAYPFVSESGPLGFLTLSSHMPRRPPAAEISALSLLAERAAAALQNVRLLNAVSVQATQLSALHEVDVAISTSLEPEEVYETITHSAAHLLHCDLVNVYRWLPEQEQLEGLATFGNARASVKGELFDNGLNATILDLYKMQRPIAITDARRDPRVGAFWRERMAARATLLVPLFYRDTFSGLLALNDTRRERHWSAAEIELAQSLGAQAAIAVANARLHAETRELLESSRQQERTVQQIINTVADGLLLLDAQHRVVLANPVAQQLLEDYGQMEDERLVTLAAMPLASFLKAPPDGRSSHEIKIRNAKTTILELNARQVEADPLAGGWFMVIHDATHEREQLAYSQAQDRLATVGQLAAGIAHDFNNILAVIVLYAQTLQRSNVPPRDRERLRAIYQQAQRASSLIAQILDFSRRSVVERRALELQPFLEELVQMLRRTLPETISVQFEIEAGAATEAVVSVDPTRLQQALMNLALNARDAMANSAQRGGELRLTLAAHEADWQPPLPDMQRGRWIALTVADSGSGISSDVLPHIFEPFFTTKMPGQGTGLGLAQVYGIVKQHDGFIDVQSRSGAGAAFTIYLPPFATGPGPESEPAFAPVSGNNELILVVEDESAIQNAVREILELLGYRVLLAADGQEALECYEEAGGEIDLVLSDMVMPRMDGARLYHALRQRDPDLKLILFTGYPLDEAGKSFVEEESVTWIQKPFNAETLDAAIRRALDE